MSQFNSPNSCHIFNDSGISDGDKDLKILRSSRTDSNDKKSCDSGNEESFHKITANTKSIGILSCENNLFIDENIPSESEKTHENKKMNEDSLISTVSDNKEDKFSASVCDFSNELPSTTTHKLNHDNFKHIKRSDIDKHSMQKPLQISYDESNSGSCIMHSSPLPSFLTDSTEMICSRNSTKCFQVDQSNTTKANSLNVVLENLSDKLQDNCASNNAYVDLGILTRELVLHTTVKDFCSREGVRNILSELCFKNDSLPLFYLQEKYSEINGDFEKFLHCTVLSLVEKYAQDTIFDMFPRIAKLETEKISTNKIFQYFYERCNDNEVFYVSKFLRRDQLLTLAAVTSKLSLVGLMLIYDDFNKGSKNWRDTFSYYNV